MRKPGQLIAAILSVLGGVLAGAASAEPLQRQALVITADDYPGGSRLADAARNGRMLSKTLFGLGFQVTRLDNPAPAVLRQTLSRMAAQPGPMVIYYAGHAYGQEGKTVLFLPKSAAPEPDKPLAADALTLDDALTRAGISSRQVMLFLDTCQGGSEPALADREALSAPPDLPGLFVAMASAPGTVCAPESAPLAPMLRDKLSAPGIGLAEMFPPVADDDASNSGVWAFNRLQQDFVFRPADSGTRLTTEDYRMLERLSPEEREKMLALWQAAGIAVDIRGGRTGAKPLTVIGDNVVIAAPVQPVQTTGIGGAAAATRAGGIGGTLVRPGETLVLAANPVAPASISRGSSRRPRPVGLPEPSIILGRPGPDLGALPEVDYTNVAARRELRGSDPQQFELLLVSGAYDPPSADLASALQTELSRMECYGSGIDGQWGPGSRAALERYYQAIGESPQSLEATSQAFRQILRRDDITCPPATRAATPAPRNAAPQQRSAAPQPQAAQPAAQQPTNERRINRSGSVGVGIVR